MAKKEDVKTIPKKLGLLSSNVPTGSIIAYAGIKTPDGWLLCDGKTKKSKDLKCLYEAIGTSWGNGDGSPGSFNLPDLRGLFLRGVDGDANNDPDHDTRELKFNGGNKGNIVGSYQGLATALPKKSFNTDISGLHYHSQYKVFHGQNLEYGDFLYAGNQTTDQQLGTTSQDGNHSHSIISGGDKETRPQNAYVYYIIKD